ncbi:MAG: hypothetical protein ACI9HK_005508 [Pirellulaceae bacterium]
MRHVCAQLAGSSSKAIERWRLIDKTLNSARELVREIWDIEQHDEIPELAEASGRFAERMSNLGLVIIYCLFVSYGGMLIYRMIPDGWIASGEYLYTKWWFWCLLALVVIGGLRFGLGATKFLKRWNIASVLSVLLLFDCILKHGPPLFGADGYSYVDTCLGSIKDWRVYDFVEKMFGL